MEMEVEREMEMEREEAAAQAAADEEEEWEMAMAAEADGWTSEEAEEERGEDSDGGAGASEAEHTAAQDDPQYEEDLPTEAVALVRAHTPCCACSYAPGAWSTGAQERRQGWWSTWRRLSEHASACRSRWRRWQSRWRCTNGSG